MKAKPLVKVNTDRKKLVAKRVAGGCGCGKKKTVINNKSPKTS
ncbi:hypothetical protein [Ornithinibacillus hominis]|nr:hypothetical protein [Ornithinibacillus hominis]